MMRILSLGYPDLAFFHLLAHALFKALLFMCAGAVIHSMKDYQDIRIMGGLIYYMPLTGMCINLANLALCGTPFLAGFYSKDIVLELAFISPLNLLVFMLYALSTGLTVCYTFRLVFYTISGSFNLGNLYLVSDESPIMTNPIMGLRVGAIIRGAILSWIIFPCPYMICMTLGMKTLALSVSVLGGFLGYVLNLAVFNYKLNSIVFYDFTVFLGSMWFIPYLSTRGAIKSFLELGETYQKVGDGGWSEYYGGQGTYRFIREGSCGLQALQDNSMKIYILSFFLWVVTILILIL